MIQLSDHELAALVENTEAAAFADMVRAAPAALGLDARTTPSCTVLQAPGFDVLLLNRALRVGVDAPVSEGDMRETIEHFQKAGTKNFGIQLGPASQPAVSREWLTACGLQIRDAWTKVYRGAASDVAIATDLRIERVPDRDADLFGTLACQGFGMPAVWSPLMAATVGRPGWRHYIARSGDEPGAVAALFVRGSAGWLGVAATLPAFRRRGAQGALMARRVRDAAVLGCKWLVTETGQETPEKPNPSYRNMKRAGFADAYHRPNYMLPKS